MNDLSERINNFIVKYHELHASRYRTQDEANKELRKIGAKKIKSIPRDGHTTHVYRHPKYGTFTTIEDKKKKRSQAFHYPVSSKDVRDTQLRGRVYLQENEIVPKGKKEYTGPKGGRFYLV